MGEARRLGGRWDERQRRVLISLLCVIAAIFVVLIVSDDPFRHGVAERLAKGKRPGPGHYWASYGWPVLFVGMAFLAALAATVPRWLGRKEPLQPMLPPRPMPRLGVVLVLAAMVLGASCGAPRLTQSLWDDEAYNVQNTMVGRWRVHPATREVDYAHATWYDVFFGYRNPNNHVPHTALGRIAHRVGDLVAPREDRAVDEWVIRMPAFLAGIAATAVLAWFLWRLGFSYAAVVAAWLVALHPWILRYHTEARGYSLAMLLASLLLGTAVLVLERGTWRRWLSFGAAQFLLIWTFVPTVYLVAFVNLGVLFMLWQRRQREDAAEQGVRFAVTNLASGLAWLTVMLPNLAQLLGYLGIDKGRVWMSEVFFRRLGGLALAGTPYRQGGGAEFPDLFAVWSAHPVGVSTWVAVVAAALLLGIVRCVVASGAVRALSFALFLPAPLAFFQLWWSNDRAYVWYFLVFVPSALALIAIGSTWLLEARSRAARGLGMAWVVGLLAGLLVVGAPARQALRDRSFFPMREAALATRPTLDASDPRNRQILTASWSAPPRYYDPLHHYTPKKAELVALMREADRSSRRLYVNLGRMNLAARRSPENLALVRDPRFFALVAEFPGFSPERSRVVYRYIGGWPAGDSPVGDAAGTTAEGGNSPIEPGR